MPSQSCTATLVALCNNHHVKQTEENAKVAILAQSQQTV